MKQSSTVFIIALFLVSCGTAKPPDYQGISKFKVHSLGASESVIRFHLDYFNPNAFGVTMKDAEFDVYVENEYLGKARLEEKIRIPAKSSFSIPIRMTAASASLLKHSFAMLMNTPLQLKVEGTTKVGKAGFYKKYPVFFEGKQAVREE